MMVPIEIVWIASGILIGIGLSAVWRDIRTRRRNAVLARLARGLGRGLRKIFGRRGSQSVAEVPVGRLTPLETTIAGVLSDEAEDERPGGDPLPRIEKQWTKLEPAIAAGVAKVNGVLEHAAVRVAEAGQPAWSYKNRGYGNYRRVLLSGESLAWLRVELSADGNLHVRVRAHSKDRSDLNSSAKQVRDEITDVTAGDLLAECLKPLASYASQLAATQAENMRTSEAGWTDIAPLVTAALLVSNGALAQTGARLTPLGPAALVPEVAHHRLVLAVELDNAHIARMHVERVDRQLEVAVGVSDPQLMELASRRLVDIESLDTHALAELMVGAAWPLIANARSGGQAGRRLH